MSETTRQFKKQLPKNAAMAVLNFLTYSITAIWLTPYLYKHLGPAAYGMVPLAGLLTQYAAIITGQISGAVNRFLTIEIQKPDGNPNVVFNSSFALYLILIAVQFPLFWGGIYFADRIFTFPAELKSDVLILLGCSAATFLINMIGSVFGTSLYAKNRLDIGYVIGFSGKILSLILIVAAFATFGPKLRFIGIIGLFIQCISFVVGLLMWRKLTPELSLNLKDIDWRLFGPVFHMSFWSLVSQLGALLYLRTDIWIINRFISATAAGQYAAVLVVANFIRQLANMGNGQFGPVIMTYWAKGETSELHRLLVIAVKVFVFFLGIPVVLICVNGGMILSTWLGPEFQNFGPLLAILTLHLCINTAVYPLFNLFPASNSVRVPAIVTFVMGAINVVASYVLGVKAGMGAMGVALATAVVLTLKNAVFTPTYSAYILKKPFWVYMGPLFRSIPLMGLVYLLSLVPFSQWLRLDPQTVTGVLVQSMFVGICSVVLGWFVVFERRERNKIYIVVMRKARVLRG